MTLFAALLWVVQVANAADDQDLDRFGIKPRRVDGLWGVLTAPFLHSSWDHVLSNTLPVILIGWVVLIGGWREWLTVTGVVIAVGGGLTWLIGPAHAVIVGASGLVFGWLAYLIARAWFSRRLKWIVVAVLVLAFFGTLLSGLVPVPHSQVSWQAHVAGFVAGVGAGALLHTRWASRALTRRSAVS